MKVNDLLNQINEGIERYGECVLDWDVYLEQLEEEDKKGKGNWDRVYDNEGWEYYKSEGGVVLVRDKYFCISVNY